MYNEVKITNIFIYLSNMQRISTHSIGELAILWKSIPTFVFDKLTF